MLTGGGAFHLNKKRMKQKEKDKNDHFPRVAPGMTEEAIEEKATPEEVAQGEFTRVIKLEVDRNAPLDSTNHKVD